MLTVKGRSPDVMAGAGGSSKTTTSPRSRRCSGPSPARAGWTRAGAQADAAAVDGAPLGAVLVALAIERAVWTAIGGWIEAAKKSGMTTGVVKLSWCGKYWC